MPRKPADEALQQLAKKFWENVKKTPCCWLWTGPTKRHGAGPQVHIPEDTLHGPCYVPAHYLSWYLKYGGWPRPKSIERHCDELLCVRPSHYHRKPKAPRIRTKKVTAPSDAPAGGSVGSAVAAVGVSAEQASPALLFAVARELRDHVAEHRRAVRLLLTRFDAVTRQMAAVASHVEGLTLQGAEPKPVSLPTDYAPQLDRIQEAIEELVPTELRAAARPAPDEADPPPELTPSADGDLRTVLDEAFLHHVHGRRADNAEQGDELERAFDVALNECDGDSSLAGKTFGRWLSWFSVLVSESGNGRPVEPTRAAFLSAVSLPAPGRPPPVRSHGREQ